jgi:hypothetical protein
MKEIVLKSRLLSIIWVKTSAFKTFHQGWGYGSVVGTYLPTVHEVLSSVSSTFKTKVLETFHYINDDTKHDNVSIYARVINLDPECQVNI